MAYTAIRLAIDGQTVYLFDPSLVLNFGMHFGMHQHFKRAVQQLIAKHFSDHQFVFRAVDHTLRYVGRKVSLEDASNSAPKNDILAASIEDDGSDEREPAGLQNTDSVFQTPF